jgi:hypothetical protein
MRLCDFTVLRLLSQRRELLFGVDLHKNYLVRERSFLRNKMNPVYTKLRFSAFESLMISFTKK